MGVDREHVYLGRALPSATLAASAVAAALVRRDALRLRLSADAALRDGRDLEGHPLLAGQGIPLLYRLLLLCRDRRRLLPREGRDQVTRRRVAGSRRDRADVPVAAVPRRF